MAFDGPPVRHGPAVLPVHADRRLLRFGATCDDCDWHSDHPKKHGRVHVLATGHRVVEVKTYEVAPR